MLTLMRIYNVGYGFVCHRQVVTDIETEEVRQRSREGGERRQRQRDRDRERVNIDRGRGTVRQKSREGGRDDEGVGVYREAG